ncbi:MAG: ribokinase [Bryobacteraceae bacterium]|nr:ribokinase [Bryobacteraceae bacterium]
MNIETILAGLSDLRVLVVGDICLDRWCHYDPTLAEASAETGIPRTAVVRTSVTPGAGGTIANNLASLGVGSISVLGVIGEDGFGFELRSSLALRGVDSSLLITSRGVNTFTYTKLIDLHTHEEDLARVDFINTRPLPSEVEQSLVAALVSSWELFDVVMVSDQAETGAGGVVTPAVRDAINRLAVEMPGPVVWVDSRKRPEMFHNVILKPNQQEAEDACRRKFGTIDFARLAVECKAPLMIVTHGSRGALVIEGGNQRWISARQVTPVDICGAGDSFSAGAACALRITGSSDEAARFGNLVASVTVTKKGTGTASPAELLAVSSGEAARV